VKIDCVIAAEKNSQSFIVQAYIGHQGIENVLQIHLPVFSHPREQAVNPDAESEIVAPYMVFLSHVRKIKVSNAVVTVETYKKLSITDRDISWHAESPLFLSDETIDFGETRLDCIHNFLKYWASSPLEWCHNPACAGVL
jgi:hypothetical protein